MNKVKVNLTYCYGIKHLETEFEFSETNVYTIYAPNGSMKTSFAKTFKDLSLKQKSHDWIYPSNEPIRIIEDENGVELENIFVIERLDDKFESDKRHLLLAQAELQKKYQEAYKEIEAKEAELIDALRPLCGYTKTELIKNEVNDVYKQGTFFECLLWVYKNVKSKDTNKYESIDYRNIFNSDNINLLNTHDVRTGLVEYFDKYQELVGKTKYLKPEFDHYGASEVQKALDKNGFFKARHSVVLKSKDGEETIHNDVELQRVFTEEMQGVIEDTELKKRFDTIDKAFSKEGQRVLRKYLNENRFIIPELMNPDKLRNDVWNEFFSQPECNASLISFFKTHKAKKAEIESLVVLAKEQQSDWKIVVDKFNTRFSVPFKLIVSNEDDVVLKSEKPSIKFVYQDMDGVPKTVDKETLQKVLSCGEQRALYILNIMFEIQARIKQGIETLLIIDDIADSFDYKNKYAIIEYLCDMAKSGIFKMIIMTHNFDFFRNTILRIGVDRKYNLVPIKTPAEVFLQQAYCQKSPFEHWLKGLNKNDKYLLSSIPLVRNLAQYTMNSGVFKELTKLLHIKPETDTITVRAMIDQFKKVCSLPDVKFTNDTQKVIDILNTITAEIIASPEYNNLEDKLILAIAVRLKAERFMLAKISDTVEVDAIQEPQTINLFKLYELEHNKDLKNIEILNRVVIMTPENIHLNSFMYEPILDMDIGSLIQLYHDLPV